MMPGMETELRQVTMANRGELGDIDPGPAARGWVHAPWYWHQASLDRADLVFRLIYVLDSAAAVGMVAYGQAYADRELTKPVRGRYELAHLVIDHRSQRKGIGRAVARRVLAALADQADCRELVVAHHPDNQASRTLFTALGLAPSTERNYDGDPMLIAEPALREDSAGEQRAAQRSSSRLAMPDGGQYRHRSYIAKIFQELRSGDRPVTPGAST